MSEPESPDFASLLRRFRTEAALTQEELAERARVSVRAVSDLERGVITCPRPFTVRQLTEALDLSAEEQARFTAAAIPKVQSEDVEASLPRGNFLGARPVGPLIARDREMDRLRAALTAATEGAGCFVLLEGEHGVGTTRLLQEVMLEALRRNCVVLTGQCYEIEEHTSYFPLMTAFAGLGAHLPADRRGEAQRLGRRLKKRPPERTVENEDTRGLVPSDDVLLDNDFGEMVAFTERIAPLVLLLDCLHWCDRYSLKVLHHIAQQATRARVLIVGGFCDVDLMRNHPPFASMLLTLNRQRLVDRLAVRRLSSDESAELIEAMMEEGGVSEEFAAFVYRRTKGNPLLIDELVRSLGGRLQLQAEIGAGSTGRVFRALDHETDSVVAAKLVLARSGIDLDALLHFQREASVLASLSHPNIVRIHDTFVEEHAACIIMEMLEGRSLGKVLEDGPMPLSTAKKTALQTIQAIAYAHSHSIVHRDIKPDNIMILETGDVKVTDFGIARILHPDTSIGTIATTGMRVGTPLYMAPEQIEGGKIDGRTDVYALGALMFHMVTGRPPFRGEDALSVAVKHLQETPLNPSEVNNEVPSGWDAVILKALSKHPANRFQSVNDMIQAVTWLNMGGEHSVGAKRLKWPVRVAVGAAAAAAFAVLVVALWLQGPTITVHATLTTELRSYFSRLSKDHGLSGTVLVARRGRVLLDQGYGFANRAGHIPNQADSAYGIGGVTQVLSSTALLSAASLGEVRLSDPICPFLPSCPAAWKIITIKMLLDGTSYIPGGNGWGTPGNSVTQTLIGCQSQPLEARPGSHVGVNYASDADCDQTVMGFVLQSLNHSSWNQAGINFPGMHSSGQITDTMAPKAHSIAYQNGVPDPRVTYNDFFALYSTASDVYAFDNDFFGGKIPTSGGMKPALRPRTPLSWPDRYVTNARWGYFWRIARLFGRRVVYTLDGLNDFQTVNMRFPRDGVTVIILSNDISTDLWDTAVRAAAVVFHVRIARPRPLVDAPGKLLGTYHRIFLNSDWIAAHDPGLKGVDGQTLILQLRKRVAHTPAADEYYQATRGGLMTFLGYPPTNHSSYCSTLPSETPPTGYYHWSLHRRTLTIKRVRFDTCPDRGAFVPGVWTKVS